MCAADMKTEDRLARTAADGFAGWAGLIVPTVLCRLVINTARRFAYTFAPVLSRGLGVPLTSVTSLVALNQATSLVGVFFGPLADRFGYRLMMLAGLGFLVAGMFAGGLWPCYGIVAVSLFLAGLGKTIFDPALQGYVGRRVPFHRRGLVIGLLEMAWAGSTLIGIPLIGLVIEAFDWRTPFFILGGAGLIGLVVLSRLLPRSGPGLEALPARGRFRTNWRLLGTERAALGALGFGFLVSVANDNLFVVYGAWLEDSFSLSVAALGAGTGAIGAAELTGEFLTAMLADRLGLVRSVFVGLVLVTAAYLALPLWTGSLALALSGLFLVFLAFEFTIVTFLSLCTELLPEARATMISSFLAAGGLGRVVGDLTGGLVWIAGGITAVAVVSAALNFLALVTLAWGLAGWRRKETISRGPEA
ncbi:MAG: MFS transporter [Thermodesulfobacteriota bacterium]